MLRGERLKKLRKDRGLSAEEVAQQLNMSQAQLSKYENGKIDPSTRAFVKLMNFYHVSADYLLGIVDDPNIKLLSAEEVAVLTAIRSKNWPELLAIVSSIIARGGIQDEPKEPGDADFQD